MKTRDLSAYEHIEAPQLMDKEIINKLFLELSQFVEAETEKEMLYRNALLRIRDYPVDSEPVGVVQDIQQLARETLKRAKLK